jgi:phosphate transport system permease protein
LWRYPFGLFSAIYLAEYAPIRVRKLVKPLLEVLAGVPTVVYGFSAVTTVGPALRVAGEALGLPVAGESALAAGLVMGIMIIPFVSSLSDDVTTAVPQSLRDGAYALGATRSETIRQVVLRAAFRASSAACCSRSRAIGETMIVVMAGRTRGEPHRQPARGLVDHGDGADRHACWYGRLRSSTAPKTLAAFALGLVAVPASRQLLDVIAL